MKLTDFIPNFIKTKVISEYISNDVPPADFFKQIKDKRQPVTPEILENVRNCLNKEILNFIDNGQIQSAERSLFHLKSVEREQKVIDAGITKYVERDDLDDFLLKVSNQVVKIIELEDFERKIPDEQSEQIRAVKDLFDQVYIVFTDYTGKVDRLVEKRKQARDPIAFGVFKTSDNRIWNHRFYFICDWTDDYCDLTLDKYVSQMAKAGYNNPIYETQGITISELEQRIAAIRDNSNDKAPEWRSNERVYRLNA